MLSTNEKEQNAYNSYNGDDSERHGSDSDRKRRHCGSKVCMGLIWGWEVTGKGWPCCLPSSEFLGTLFCMFKLKTKTEGLKVSGPTW